MAPSNWRPLALLWMHSRSIMHRSIPEQEAYLKSVLLGHMRYYGVPMTDDR